MSAENAALKEEARRQTLLRLDTERNLNMLINEIFGPMGPPKMEDQNALELAIRNIRNGKTERAAYMKAASEAGDKGRVRERELENQVYRLKDDIRRRRDAFLAVAELAGPTLRTVISTTLRGTEPVVSETNGQSS